MNKHCSILFCLFCLFVLSSLGMQAQPKVVNKNSGSAITAPYDVRNVSFNSSGADFAPMYYRNGIVYASEFNGIGKEKYEPRKAPYLDLNFARLQSEENIALFNAPEKFSSVNTKLHEGTNSFSPDFNTMYFTANYPTGTNGVNRLRILISQWQAGQWTRGTDFPYNNPNHALGHPAISPDGKIMIFTADLPGGTGSTDLWTSRWDGSNWSKPENLGNVINTTGKEMFPFIAPDGMLYFSSDGRGGMGKLDLFRSYKLTGGGWAKPEAMPAPINSAGDDFALITNADATKGYFSSNRTGGKGDDDIYSFQIDESVPQTPKQLTCIIKGKVYEKQTKNGVSSAFIKLIETATGATEAASTDANGEFSMPINPNTDYTLYAQKRGYFTEVRVFSTKGKDCSSPLEQNIPLDISFTSIPDEPVVITSGGGNNRPDLPLPKIENIYYDFDKWDIRADAKIELNKIVAFMKDNPDIKVDLLSHTDARGTAQYNLELSEKRAKSAMEYVISQGIPPSQITSRGMGETKPANKCKDGVSCSESEHQQNRRTEFVVTVK